MQCLICVAIIFNSLFPTYCYVLPWHTLSRVRKTVPQEAAVLAPSTPHNRFEVHPGSQGMFSDIAQEIETRMRGIAKGPFIVVFDFGGIATNYVSSIEDISSESGDSVTSENRAETEPLGIEKHDMSADDGIATTQSMLMANRMLTARPMAATAGTVMSTVETPVGIVMDASSTDGEFVPMTKEVLVSTPSGLKENTSPSSTAVTIEPFDAVENIPATSVVNAESQRSLTPDSTTISPPQDWSSGKDPSNIGLSESLLKDIAHGVKEGLDGVKAVEFPGKTSIALLYPNHQVSIADKSTNEMMHFTTLTNAPVNAMDARALYTSLKPITTELSIVIKNRGFNCVPLKSTKLNLKMYVIDEIVFGEGSICGLENMQPGNNVTITKDDEDTMEVTMPLILKDLTVKINSVDVNHYFFTIIKGQPIEASVKRISCKGTFSFRKGTFFKLSSIHIEWEDITGIHIKLEGALEEGGTVSGIIDNLAGALSGVIKSFISPILEEIEKQIITNILGS